MFERLLAALIILALLVLVMFIALPYPTGSDRVNSPVVDQPLPAEPAKSPTESARVKSPTAGQNEVANNEAAPQTAEKPAPSAQETPVPNPPGNNNLDSNKAPAPAPAEKGARELGRGEAQPKQKFVKSYNDRLSPDAELPAKPLETAKADKPATETPVADKPKSDKLTIHKLKPRETRTETVSRTPVQQRRPRVYIKEERERGDGIGEYIRRTDYGPPGWHRTHYYECADGRCDCSCDRPYWARRSGPPCWD
jgi:hypothetical protein